MKKVILSSIFNIFEITYFISYNNCNVTKFKKKVHKVSNTNIDKTD